MRYDVAIVILAEWIALICWAIQFRKKMDIKHKLFILYLFVIAWIELLNFAFGAAKFRSLNFFVNHIIVPTEFLFIFYYLLWNRSKLLNWLTIVFASVYLVLYMLDRSHFFEQKNLFDSLSYGIGCLFIMLSIVFASRDFMQQERVLYFTKTTLFWVIIGIAIFYLGSFPYYNFKVYLWSNEQYHSLAFILHYVSQSFCAIMYLLFAYAAKWIVK